MQPIRSKIKLVIVLLVIAIGIIAVIYLRGGLGISGADKTPIKRGDAAIADYSDAQPVGSPLKGEEIFKEHCTSCHAMESELTGPALMGVLMRVPSDTFVEALLINPAETIKNNPYANTLYKKYGKMGHPSFRNILTKQQIRDVIFFLDTSEPIMHKN